MLKVWKKSEIFTFFNGNHFKMINKGLDDFSKKNNFLKR